MPIQQLGHITDCTMAIMIQYECRVQYLQIRYPQLKSFMAKCSTMTRGVLPALNILLLLLSGYNCLVALSGSSSSQSLEKLNRYMVYLQKPRICTLLHSKNFEQVHGLPSKTQIGLAYFCYEPLKNEKLCIGDRHTLTAFCLRKTLNRLQVRLHGCTQPLKTLLQVQFHPSKNYDSSSYRGLSKKVGFTFKSS